MSRSAGLGTGRWYRAGMELALEWLGRVDYRAAWARQHAMVDARAAGEIRDTLLLLEHPPVLTLGRQADAGHVRASDAELGGLGIELIRVERGGDVTYHGPGQLVAYPIVKLADRGILLRPFVRALEASMIETCATYGVPADRRDGHPGCWVSADGPAPRKIGALGVRVERGVSYHGIALNVTTRLDDFALIDPCGMPDVVVTSIAVEAGWAAGAPTIASVREAADRFALAFTRTLEAAGAPMRSADPAEALTAMASG